MASQKRGTLYVGVTNNLIRRVYEHRLGIIDGFTKKHHVHQLVHFEETDSIESAILREKQLKNWRRAWKINWVEKHNPDWNDLYPKILGLEDCHAELVSASIQQHGTLQDGSRNKFGMTNSSKEASSLDDSNMDAETSSA